MNLFRSEEHVTGWSFYEPSSYQSIMPIRHWAYVMGSTVFSTRLEADHLDRIDHGTLVHLDDFYERLASLGRSGEFWREDDTASE